MRRRSLVHVGRVGALCAAAVALSSCGGDGGSSGPPPIAPITLASGARYFAVDGQEQFLASRNIAGADEADYIALLDKAASERTRLVRFHLTHLGGIGITANGGVVEAWAARWERIFDHAQAKGIYVIPVFAVWADWNNADPWNNWANNPLNRLVGSYQTNPSDLLSNASWVQETWLGWLGNVVARFSSHDNVAAWESFSELDGVVNWNSPPAEPNVLVFVQAAAAAIKGADPRQRPVTVSTGSWSRYPNLYANAAVDIAQFHLYANSINYPTGGDFDVVLHDIIASLRVAAKPILIGEGGLSYLAPDGTTATTLPHHDTATRHAVWAALVSGAMNGRGLWWEDGYDIQQNPTTGGPEFVYQYPAVEKPAVTFLDGLDVSGFVPVPNANNSAVVGWASGNAETVIAWFRSTLCAATHAWDCSTTVSGVTELFTLPSDSAASWHVTAYDASTGEVLQDLGTKTRSGTSLAVQLPTFSDDIALEMVAVPTP